MTSRADILETMLAPKTLADVAAWLANNTDLPSRRKADLASALSTMSKITGKPLEHLPAHVGEIRRLIDQKSPAECGMKTASHRNFKSRIFKLLKKAGCRVVPARHREPLSPEWQALWVALNEFRRLRYDLSHVMHWHAANGIPPEAAGAATFEAYHRDTVEFGTKEHRHAYYKQACIAWNRASEKIAPWPKTTVPVPMRRKAKARPWPELDPRLESEAQAYLASLGTPSSATAAAQTPSSRPWRSVSSGKKKRKLLRDGTIKRREFDIRLYTSMALKLGFRSDQLTSLRDLVSTAVAGRVIDDLWEKAGKKPTTHIASFAWMIRGIAEHWVNVDPEHLAELSKICAFVEPERGGMTPENRARLDQVQDPTRELALRWLPNNLAARAGKSKIRSRLTARTMMNACMVGLLIYCPMRRHNLAALRLDRHIRRIPKGKATMMVIEIPGAEVKNGVPTRYPVPAEIAAMIDEYVAHYRLLICPNDCPWLFPTSGGKPVHRNAVSARIKKLIHLETGLRWNPHLFRHWGGVTYLEEEPGQYEIMRRVYHHDTQETSRRYLGNESEAAVRRYQETILKRRTRLTTLGRIEP